MREGRWVVLQLLWAGGTRVGSPSAALLLPISHTGSGWLIPAFTTHNANEMRMQLGQRVQPQLSATVSRAKARLNLINGVFTVAGTTFKNCQDSVE